LCGGEFSGWQKLGQEGFGRVPEGIHSRCQIAQQRMLTELAAERVAEPGDPDRGTGGSTVAEGSGKEQCSHGAQPPQAARIERDRAFQLLAQQEVKQNDGMGVEHARQRQDALDRLAARV
jgi:hypothetical protein